MLRPWKEPVPPLPSLNFHFRSVVASLLQEHDSLCLERVPASFYSTECLNFKNF